MLQESVFSKFVVKVKVLILCFLAALALTYAYVL